MGVLLGASGRKGSAQLDGFKSRELKGSVPAPRSRRWLYEVEWSRVGDAPEGSQTGVDVLVVGNASAPLSAALGGRVGFSNFCPAWSPAGVVSRIATLLPNTSPHVLTPVFAF